MDLGVAFWEGSRTQIDCKKMVPTYSNNSLLEDAGHIQLGSVCLRRFRSVLFLDAWRPGQDPCNQTRFSRVVVVVKAVLGSHFGVGEFTTHFRIHFSGDWDVYWKYFWLHEPLAQNPGKWLVRESPSQNQLRPAL